MNPLEWLRQSIKVYVDPSSSRLVEDEARIACHVIVDAINAGRAKLKQSLLLENPQPISSDWAAEIARSGKPGPGGKRDRIVTTFSVDYLRQESLPKDLIENWMNDPYSSLVLMGRYKAISAGSAVSKDIVYLVLDFLYSG